MNRHEKAEIGNYQPEHFAGRGVYSDGEILEALDAGHIRIFPFDKENLSGASYDVRLGENFYCTDRIHNRTYYNPYDRADVERYFGEPLQAIPSGEWCEKQGRLPFEGIPEDHPIIVLRPFERILAHTYEFIGIRPPGTTQMQARSTVGRNGVVVCKDAGWGDPGYCGRWTMEIQNDNNESIPLPVGMRIAQIVFLRTGMGEVDYGVSGKYYSSATLEEDIESWRPQLMLPKAYEDQVLPLQPLQHGQEIRLRK